MEEILASIRRIISDEQAPAPENPHADDVIELTQAVQDDGSIVDITVPETAAVEVAPEPEPIPAPPPVQEIVPPVVEPPVPSQPLLSEQILGVAASSLSSLANTIEIERLSSEPQGMTALGNGGRTLEDMVIELMRPMLKQWLDQNLPSTVERLVQKEIERISKRIKD